MAIVSVIMSVYNGMDYISESISSILNQSLKDFEFIIVDDGSTDDTLSFLKSINDNRIIIIENVKNIGLPASLNKAINRSTGKYIARQDADDISFSNRLEKQLEFAELHYSDLVAASSINIDINGNYLSVNNISDCEPNHLIKTILNKKMIFAHGTAFIRREALINVGLYNESFFYAQDGELWLRFIKSHKIINFITEPLYYLRRTPLKSDKKQYGQSTYIECLKFFYHNNFDQNTDGLELLINKVNSELHIRKIIYHKYYLSNYWHYCCTTCFLGSGNREKSLTYIIRAIKEKNSIKQLLSHIITLFALILPVTIVKKILIIRRS